MPTERTLLGNLERDAISKRTIEALAAAKARGVKLGDYARIAAAKQKATSARAEAARPAIASTLHLSATAAAGDLNGAASPRRVASDGKRWQATQVIRVRGRLGLAASVT